MNLLVQSAKSIVVCLWLALGFVWLLGAFITKRTVRSQSALSRLLHLTVAVLAGAVVYLARFKVAVLARSFVSDSPAVIFTGLLLACIGIGLAIWARVNLGRNWSGTVTVKENHTLKTSGPYALVRHPIYSGLLLASLGTAICFGQVRDLLAVGLVFILLVMKARMEERFMLEQFGAEYRQYQREVSALIPFVY